MSLLCLLQYGHAELGNFNLNIEWTVQIGVEKHTSTLASLYPERHWSLRTKNMIWQIDYWPFLSVSVFGNPWSKVYWIYRICVSRTWPFLMACLYHLSKSTNHCQTCTFCHGLSEGWLSHAFRSEIVLRFTPNAGLTKSYFSTAMCCNYHYFFWPYKRAGFKLQ